jgi:photosystem II stability/assembly factor-like uncharacterized protein
MRAHYATLAGLCLLRAAAAPPAQSQPVDPSNFAEMRWRLIGPYRAGNVYAVSGVPTDPRVYYAGMPEGGVWKTTDGGTVWTPIFDDQHVPSIGAVTVAPSNPNVVYVGTGDPTGWSFTPGNGVYKSADAGHTWQHIGLEGTRYITSLIVDPRHDNVALVGALGSQEFRQDTNSNRGVYRTTDGGQTWRQTLYKDNHTGVSGITADYADPRFVYAAIGATIYKSTDEGATWHVTGTKGLPAEARGYYIAVASGTHGQRIYAEAESDRRDASGLYRSDDGGASWSLATAQILSAGGGPIYVDPKNPDVVYLMGTAMYRSTDGGHHVAAFKGSPGGDDFRDLWIDPLHPERMLAGVDQGPTITVDGGATWTPWYNVPNGQFYHVSTDNLFPYHVCAAQQDSGTACVLSRSDFGEIRDNDWYPVGGFEDSYIVTDPLDPRWIYVQGWYHVLRRYDREIGQMAVMYSPAPEDQFGPAPPLAFSPQDPHTMYMGAQYVLASSDGARTWRRISNDLTLGNDTVHHRRPPYIETLSPSTVSSGEIWVGTSNGLIQVTRDGGTSWTNVTPPDMPRNAGIGIVDASHHDAGVAYASAEAFGDSHPYIYRTSDFGKTWQVITAGLTDNASVRVVREDPADPNLLYAGTVMGAWVSFDRGDHWQSLQLNLPNTVVTDMVVHDNDLAISTYGRALWILDDLTPLRQARAVNAAVYLFDPEKAYRLRWDNIEDTPLPPEVPTGQNPPEGAIIDYYLETAATGPITLSVYDDQGQLVRQYSSVAPPPDTVQPNIAAYWLAPPVVLPTTAGMHRVAWDLRYPEPSVINYSYFGDLLDYREFTLNTHAVKGTTPRVQPTGPLVVPGTYRIALSVGGQTYTRSLAVENDPRESISQAALDAHLRLERQMMSGLAVSFTEFGRLRQRGTSDSAAVLADSAFGPANRDLTRHLEDMESGDVDPTPSDVAAVTADCDKIDRALARLAQLHVAASADPACH